jgi:stearoyl-CoA desaturase (delta-9 desaturase)
MKYTGKLNWPVVIVVSLLQISWLVAVWWGYSHYGAPGTFLGLQGITWKWFFVSYFLSGLGITLGYHRYFTHQGFKTYRWFQFVLMVLGSLSLQGVLSEWVNNHRHHHRDSDTDLDPHSPRHGFLHGHMLWFMYEYEWPEEKKMVTDILKDPMLANQFPYYIASIWLGLLLPAAAGYYYGGTELAFEMFLVAGVVRMSWVQHVTWLVNSWGHTWGRRPWKTGEDSTNTHIIGLIALGEGYHNNHHYDDRACIHGWDWYDLDTTKWVLYLLEKIGLVWDLQLPKHWRQNEKSGS